jgi:hypothetical protein
MKYVSRFESNLLHILHCIVGRAPIEQAWPMVYARLPRPKCLGRGAVEAVQEALAKGCALLLARQGGWRRERHLRGERVADGRLWERTPPEGLGLAFSKQSLEFLIALTACNPTDQQPPSSATGDELTIGDRLLFYLAYDALRLTDVAAGLRAWPMMADHGLCWLAAPADFADSRPDPDLAPWVSGAGAAVLEALQPALAGRWVLVERAKRDINDWRRMRAVGRAQERVLDAFLAAADAAGRRDLARFLLAAAARLLPGEPRPRDWVSSLDQPGLRVADRMETYQAALALPRRLDRLRAWERQARDVGYFDEGYAAAQLWKADWEAHDGEALWSRAQSLRRYLEPLRGAEG